MVNLKVDAVQQILTLTILLGCSQIVSSDLLSPWSNNYHLTNDIAGNLVDCYECNVWKAGYGQLCDNPRIRSGCYACMKIETVVFMGYYKNTPRNSTIISRACANSKSVPYYHECLYFTTGDGHSKRCYCNTRLCNTAHRSLITPISILTGLITAFFTVHRLA